MISPGTSSLDGISSPLPFLMTLVFYGTMFLNPSISASLFAFYINVTTHVKVTTITNTIPR